MTLRIMTLSAMTLRIMTLSTMTLSMVIFRRNIIRIRSLYIMHSE
jgi:hypothetical protein